VTAKSRPCTPGGISVPPSAPSVTLPRRNSSEPAKITAAKIVAHHHGRPARVTSTPNAMPIAATASPTGMVSFHCRILKRYVESRGR
jgi:hypothetical protein